MFKLNLRHRMLRGLLCPSNKRPGTVARCSDPILLLRRRCCSWNAPAAGQYFGDAQHQTLEHRLCRPRTINSRICRLNRSFSRYDAQSLDDPTCISEHSIIPLCNHPPHGILLGMENLTGGDEALCAGQEDCRSGLSRASAIHHVLAAQGPLPAARPRSSNAEPLGDPVRLHGQGEHLQD